MEEAIKRINQCIKEKGTVLNLSNLGLKELPNNLPNSLQELYCFNNKLKELPNNLPNSLQALYCSNNELKELPNNLPNSLRILYCHNNELKELPNNLPNSLQELYCSNNPYLHITKEQAIRFRLKATPNFTKIGRKMVQFLRRRQRFKRLRFCRQLEAHAEIFLLKPSNYLYQQIAERNKGKFGLE
jgi:Leucine-rich repeat (LRR) protein